MSYTPSPDPSAHLAPVMLGAENLPACCPNPAMPVWSSHPRVFLILDNDGRAKCPYCGTVYQLRPGAVVKAH